MIDIVLLMCFGIGSVLTKRFANRTTGIEQFMWRTAFVIMLALFAISLLGGLSYYGAI